MKHLKFQEQLVKLILEGKKHSTWRINDEKNIIVGDELSLQHKDGREFAKAQVTWTKETTFGNLTKEDKEGHEQYDSEKEMYAAYSQYYNIQVTPQTRVKIIKFRLL